MIFVRHPLQPDNPHDHNGTATVKVKYPDSLNNLAGNGSRCHCRKSVWDWQRFNSNQQPLIVRLQAPRFFVVGDQVTVSGVINNNTDATLKSFLR